VTAVDRPHTHLEKVFILHYKTPLFCVFRTALIRGYPSCAPPLPKHPRVGLDLPHLERAGHDPRLKDRDVDVEDVEDRRRVSTTIYRENKSFFFRRRAA
jgi:hypothetical protein